jgi:hypothetical protein
VLLSLRWLLKDWTDKSPGTDQIPTEVITGGSRTIRSEIRKFINSIWNTKELPVEWKKSIITPIYTQCDKADCSNYSGVSLGQLCTNFCPTSCYYYVILLIPYSPGVLKNFGAGSTLEILFFILWPTINWIDGEYYIRSSYLWKISFSTRKGILNFD